MTSHSMSGRSVRVSELQAGPGGALGVPRLVQWMATLRCDLRARIAWPSMSPAMGRAWATCRWTTPGT